MYIDVNKIACTCHVLEPVYVFFVCYSSCCNLFHGETADRCVEPIIRDTCDLYYYYYYDCHLQFCPHYCLNSSVLPALLPTLLPTVLFTHFTSHKALGCTPVHALTTICWSDNLQNMSLSEQCREIIATAY